ncbi:MAG: hypothetical protein KDI47_12300 [Gammaproteobacteria bacterium]|nr:hypothetical protein [Gammaproteobacteria bacterium]
MHNGVKHEWYLNRNFILVIPANAGIHNCQMAANSLDSGLHRNDELIGFSGNFSLSKCHSSRSGLFFPFAARLWGGKLHYTRPATWTEIAAVAAASVVRQF